MIHEEDLEYLFAQALQQGTVKVEKSEEHSDLENKIHMLENVSDENIDDVFDNMLNLAIKEQEIFGEWTVIGASESAKDGDRQVACRCSCGSIKNVRYTLLKHKRSTMCRSCAGKNNKKHLRPGQRTLKPPLIGQVFGKRTVIGICPELDQHHNLIIMTRCQCLKESKVRYSELLMGRSHQCRSCSRNIK